MPTIALTEIIELHRHHDGSMRHLEFADRQLRALIGDNKGEYIPVVDHEMLWDPHTYPVKIFGICVGGGEIVPIFDKAVRYWGGLDEETGEYYGSDVNDAAM